MIGSPTVYKIKSSSDIADIYVECYDVENPKGIVQIAHGMAEHCGRYKDFISELNKCGFVVYINDHLGHGKSVAHDEELGFFGNKDGYINLVNDLKIISDKAKSDFPDLPLFLFGHSMGSFLARLYTELYGKELCGAIYCGSAGKNPACGIAIILADFISKLMGTHFRSKFINKLAFGSYNKKIKNAQTDFDWLTTDEGIVTDYINDKYCGFLFTATGYRDLFDLLKKVNDKEWYNSIDGKLPLLLISGKEDPVCAYGKGIEEVYNKLKKSGHGNVQMKLYDSDRHEILNEKDRYDVINDIINWINGKL